MKLFSAILLATLLSIISVEVTEIRAKPSRARSQSNPVKAVIPASGFNTPFVTTEQKLHPVNQRLFQNPETKTSEIEKFKKFRKSQPTVNINEFLGVQEYTGKSYKAMNELARTGETTDKSKSMDDLTTLSRFAKNGISKLSTGQVSQTYRGTTKEFFTPNLQDSETWPGTKEYTDKGFFSTSMKKKVANTFARKSENDMKKEGKSAQRVVLTVLGKSSGNVQDLSKYPNQAEMVYKPGTTFTVTGNGEDQQFRLWEISTPSRRHSLSGPIDTTKLTKTIPRGDRGGRGFRGGFRGA